MKYTVIGGGTAGWLSALYLKKKFPESVVYVIASSELGILGAGEGTTPTFVSFLEFIDIPISDIVKHAKGTIKNAIKFTNWNGDTKHYYHSFLDTYGTHIFDRNDKFFDYNLHLLKKISNDENYDGLRLSPVMCENKKVKYDKNTFENYGQYALHFDANLLAKYLQSVGVKRGIQLIDDEVIKINTNSDEFITSFDLKSNNNIETDFVFDCTGFRRIIIGNFYKGQWNSYKEYLPVNRAMPFFLPNDGINLEPYTESIAMKYGWMWKIPVQGRYGCGYVFDSSFVSDEEIKQELEEYLGHEINSPRMFSFDPGCFDKVLIKNCMAIGLSSSFVEPLEATSIWISTLMLKQFGSVPTEKLLRDIDYSEHINNYCKLLNMDVLNFVHFHYLTKRNDSEFWKTFITKNKSLPYIESLSDVCKKSIPDNDMFNYLSLVETHRIIKTNINYNSIFSPSSWLQVGSGIKFYNKDIAKSMIKQDFEEIDFKEKIFDVISTSLFHHGDYLNYLKQL